MSNSKSVILVSKIISIIQLIIGVVILVIFGVSTIGYFFVKEARAFGISVLVTFLIFDIIGIFLIFSAIKTRKLIKEFKKYVSAISVDPKWSIDNLASFVGKSQDVVKKNIELMIKRKYFVNMYINQKTNCLMRRNISNSNNINSTADINQQYILKPEYVTYTCKNCGGVNRVVKGNPSVCDYCGSPIYF